MRLIRCLAILTLTLLAAAGCSSNSKGQSETLVQRTKADSGSDSEDSGTDAEDAGPTEDSTKTVLDLTDVKTHPEKYTWFDFRPNVKKLILAGAAETEHVAILWYTVADGGVALHYHSKTESVYVIDGTQTDDKGSYPTGSVYFNPPGSGHQVRDSSGFFLLAYASPPDFAKTDLIEAYTPIRIDTHADLKSEYTFETKGPGIETYAPALDKSGGMSAVFISSTATDVYTQQANYLTVLDGSCTIDGKTSAVGTLVVAKGVAPRAFELSAANGGSCLVLGVSF